MKNWTTDEVFGLIEVHPNAHGDPLKLAKAMLKGEFYHRYDVVTQRTHFKLKGKGIFDTRNRPQAAIDRVKRRHARLLAQLMTEQEKENAGDRPSES